MIPVHPTLIAVLQREKEEAILREAERRRLIREVRAARTRSHTLGWVSRVRLIFPVRLWPAHRIKPRLSAHEGSGDGREAA